MAEYDITVTAKTSTDKENISTDGYIIIFMDGNKMKFKGTLEPKVLMPIIGKIMADKLSKW